MSATTKGAKPPRPRRRRTSKSPQSPDSAARPVPLFKRSSSHFATDERRRGEAHQRNGRVQLEIDGSRCRATVVGADKETANRVGVDWRLVPERRALHAFCTCERFAEGRACEHLWAVLLGLGEAGDEAQPSGKDRVGLRKDRANRWADLAGGLPTYPDTGSSPSVVHAAPPRGSGRSRRGRGGKAAGRSPVDAWRTQMAAIRDAVEAPPVEPDEDQQAQSRKTRLIRVLVNTTITSRDGGLILDVFTTRRGAPEDSSKLRPTSLLPEDLTALLYPAAPEQGPSGVSPMVISLPQEPAPRGGKRHQGRGRQAATAKARLKRERVRRFRLPPELFDPVLPHLSREGALGWWDGRLRSPRHLLGWDDGAPWQLAIRLETEDRSPRILGSLVRGEEVVPLSAARAIATPEDTSLPAFAIFTDTIGRLAVSGPRELEWIRVLRETGDIVVPNEQLAEAIGTLVEIPDLPHIEGPEEFQLTEETSPLRPRLVLESDAAAILPNAPLLAKQSFLYGDLEVGAEDPRPSVIDWQERTFVRRDMDGEHAALLRLLEAGAEPVPTGRGHDLQISQTELPLVVEPLLADGWEIEVRGTALHLPDPPAMKVESGIDWFEVSGSADFAGDRIELKKILQAVSNGDRFLELEDGSRGLLPAAWMDTYDSLAKLAHEDTDDGLRFLSSQALFVDLLLAAMPPADVDGAFEELREKLKSFDRIKPTKEPRGFKGELRTYQREGLAWLGFLREFGLGGVLADDMGLGKTVQVLALLRANRTPKKTTGLPSLVIAPRSLVYNWIEEAARFTPSLKVVEYRGPGREALKEKFADFDIVVTTYGTLRRDVDFLSTVQFDTLILDEAQALKNRESLAAKASRLLQARNRLALTGTPIENHLGELGSLFEILNPGLTGKLPRLEILNSGRNASRTQLALVAEGIRPFILRRTKAQVLKDLPPKTEQILYCTLREPQQEIYDKLHLAYKGSLLGEVESKGTGGSAIQILEALLRLRQVACHPGLVDPSWEKAGSAKLDALFDHVSEVLEEGHKVIVFSQFTKLLGFVRKHLDEKGSTYAYLDGQTRDRGEVVDRFQTDPEVNLFLISLKAGGLGLNLTAAGYVFLLDPWWNPAVEAQAIDRAHRIGQTQPVFAYRMIARGTVEEKILELQRAKRKIVEAVLDGDRHSMPDLTADDLRALIS